MPRESPARGAEGSVPARWWQRAVPVTALAVLAAGATVALAGSNDEVRVSTSRQEQPFVELVLLQAPDRVCGKQVARVRFAVVSHLDAPETLRWRVAADPARKGRKTVARTGEVALDPEAARQQRVRVRAPRRGAYDVTVTLADRPETLRVHCEGGAR
jgi:hypothetical protein